MIYKAMTSIAFGLSLGTCIGLYQHNWNDKPKPSQTETMFVFDQVDIIKPIQADTMPQRPMMYPGGFPGYNTGGWPCLNSSCKCSDCDKGCKCDESSLYDKLLASSVTLTIINEDTKDNDPDSWGTGFIVKSKNNYYVLTCAHIFSDLDPTDEEGIKGRIEAIQYTNNRTTKLTYPVKLIRYSPMHPKTNKGEDLSVLRIDTANTKPTTYLKLCNKEPKVGDDLYQAGTILRDPAKGLVVANGILGTTNVPLFGKKFMHSTASMGKGSSGGPVINKNLEVLGIGTCMLHPTCGMFVPTSRIKAWLKKVDLEYIYNTALDEPTNEEEDEHTIEG